MTTADLVRGRRRLGLFGMALLAAVHSFACLPVPGAPLPVVVALVSGDTWRGAVLWVVVWGVLALLSLGCAILRRPGWGVVATLTALSFFWGTAYLAAWLMGDARFGYVLATAYIGLALVIFALVPHRTPWHADVD